MTKLFCQGRRGWRQSMSRVQTAKLFTWSGSKTQNFLRGFPLLLNPLLLQRLWKSFYYRYSNGHTYFFKNDLYYRFNSTTASVDVGYPKRIQTYWTGIPDKVHAAFTWYNGGVYFFKDAEFWLFIPRVEVNEIKLLWPRSIKIWWKDREQLTGYSVFRYESVTECWLWYKHLNMPLILESKFKNQTEK